MAVKTILVVDDDDGIQALLSAALGNNMLYRVLLARDGLEALHIARQELPDLMFLDVSMPKMDGHEVCRALKEDPATTGIRVVMLSALVQDAHRQKALAAGADEYVTKPFSPTKLLDKVLSALDHV